MASHLMKNYDLKLKCFYNKIQMINLFLLNFDNIQESHAVICGTEVRFLVYDTVLYQGGG